MVHKRYVWKNGKRHGPYKYESYREDGQVKKRYLGSEDRNSKSFVLLMIFLGVIILLGVVWYFSASFTGSVILEFSDDFQKAEILSGNLKLSIKEGELLPGDSVLRVESNGEVKNYLISDLISLDAIEGDFYVEGTEISGTGSGFGLIGSRETFPEITFQLSVGDGPGQGTGSSSSSSDDSDEVEVGTDGDAAAEDPEAGSDDTTGSDDSGDSGGSTEDPESGGSEGDSTEDTSPGNSGGNSQGEENSQGKSQGSENSNSNNNNGNSGNNGNNGNGNGPSGSVILETPRESAAAESIVSGRVSKGENYTLELEGSQTVSLISESVRHGELELDDSEVKLDLKAKILTVSTEYTVIEEGFGQDYLGSNISEVLIDLESLNISGEDDFTISLVKGSTEIVKLNQDNEKAETKEPVNETANETVVNQTVADQTSEFSFISNISLVRITKGGSADLDLSQHFSGAERYGFNVTNISGEFNGNVLTMTPDPEFKGARQATVIAYSGNDSLESNQFNILVSSGRLNVKTNRSQIRLGEKVNWTKSVTVDSAETITIDLPEKAENIEVKKIEESGEEEVDATVRDTVNQDEGLLGLFGSFLSFDRFTITGRAVDSGEQEEETGIEVEIEVTESDLADEVDGEEEYEIVYETEAPFVASEIEFETDEGTLKELVISGPDGDEVGEKYTDVFSFTNVPEVVSVDNTDLMFIYWKEGEMFLEADFYDLNGNNLVDYAEWITPILSNQTFEIIHITDALHLDSSRNVLGTAFEQVKAEDGITYTIPGNDYLRVFFEKNLTDANDITIYASTNDSGQVEVYEKDGSSVLAKFESIGTSIGRHTILLENLTGLQDGFDLRSTGSISYDFVYDPAITECGFINSFGVYTLSSDIVGSSGACITINASNVVFDGQGNTISFGNGASAGKGILVVKDLVNVTIKNTIILKRGEASNNNYGIEVEGQISQSGYGLILNNTIKTNGTYANYGINGGTGNSDGNDNWTIINNTIWANGTREDGEPAGTNYGIHWNGLIGGKIEGNHIESYDIGPVAIFLRRSWSSISSENVTIIGNNLTIGDQGAGGSNSATIMLTLPRNVTVKNNNITVHPNSGGVYTGIRLAGSSRGSFLGNFFQGRGLHGQSGDYSNNTIAHNIFNTTQEDAITVDASVYGGGDFTNINITNNSFVDKNTTNYDLTFYDDSSTDFNHDTTVNGSWFTDIRVGNYSFYPDGSLIHFEGTDGKGTSFGEASFIELINGSGANLTNHVIIKNNSIKINSSDNVAFNNHVNLTFYKMSGRGFKSPVIYKDGTPCGLECYNFTSMDADTITFNVTGDGVYTVGNSTFNNNVTMGFGWNYFAIVKGEGSSGDDRNVTVEPGWNLIGYSSSTAATHSSLTFHNSTGNVTSIFDAVKAQVAKVQNYFSFWNNSLEKYEFVPIADTSFREYNAYWTFVNESGNITFPNVGGAFENETIAWSDVKWSNGVSTQGTFNALSSGWIGLDGDTTENVIRRYRASTQEFLGVASSDALQAWKEGYVVWSNIEDLTLVIDS